MLDIKVEEIDAKVDDLVNDLIEGNLTESHERVEAATVARMLLEYRMHLYAYNHPDEFPRFSVTKTESTEGTEDGTDTSTRD